MSSTTVKRTYKAAQIAAILQMPVDEVYRTGREIPGRIRIGRRTRWDADTFDAWLSGDYEETA